MAEREIVVKFNGDEKDLERATKAAEKAIKGVEDGADASAGKLGKFGAAAGGFVAGIATGELISLGKDLFSLGQQLDVMNKKAATVFEDSLPSIKNWSKETAASFGLTQNQLTGLAANFGDLVKPMGFTSTQAADMAQKVIGLAGALSAWTGGQRSATDVAQTLTKAMLGEREELKGLGISISEADVQARLLKNGQQELTGAALEQAKAQATLQLIFEKSTDAQTFWNSSSAENIKKTNELKAKFGEMQEQLAEKLYPIFIKLGTWLVETGIPKIEEIAKKIQIWWDNADGLRDALGAIAETGVKLGEWFTTLIKWLDEGIQKIEAFGNALDDLQRRLGIGGELNQKIKELNKWADEVNKYYQGNDPNKFVGPVAPPPPPRANGGPVSMNMPYMVGERGPELFVPNTDGTIIPNGAGMGVTVNVNALDASSITPALARKLADSIRRELAAVA